MVQLVHYNNYPARFVFLLFDIVRFSLVIFIKFRIENIIIIQKIRFNTILMIIQFFSYWITLESGKKILKVKILFLI